MSRGDQNGRREALFFFKSYVKTWNDRSRNRLLSIATEKKAFADWMWREMTEKPGDNLGKKIRNFVLDKLIKIGMISIFCLDSAPNYLLLE